MATFARWLAEFRRRRVFRAAAWYGALAWLVIQFAVSVFPTLDFPAWTTKFVVILALLGLPATIVLAWVLDVRTTSPDAGEGPATSSGESSPRRARMGWSVWLALGAGILLGVGALNAFKRISTATAITPTLLVLAPADLRPADQRGDNLPTRIQEAILDTMGRDPSLSVISRSTAETTSRTGTDPQAAAKSLGATHFIESSIKNVDQDGSPVLSITLQVIEAGTNMHVYSFNQTYRIDSPVPIEKDVASTTTGVTRLLLTGDTWAPGGEIRTTSKEAMALYRQAEVADRYRVGEPKEELLERAVSLDGNFQQARARQLENQIREIGYPADSPDRLAELLDGALSDHAVEARPELALARALALYGIEQYSESLKILDAIKPEYLMSPRFHVHRGFVLRTVGRYDEELESYQAAFALDPYFYWPYTNIAGHGLWHHDYQRAIRLLTLAADRWPRRSWWRYQLIGANLAQSGNVQQARRELSALEAAYPELVTQGVRNKSLQEYDVALAWLEGDLGTAVARSEELHDYCFTGLGLGWVLRTAFACTGDLIVMGNLVMGERQKARAAFDANRLRDLAKRKSPGQKVDESPSELDDTLWNLWSRVLSDEPVDRGELLRAIDTTVRRYPDQEAQAAALLRLAAVAAWSGHGDVALDLLRKSVDAPFGAYAQVVARDPVWAPLYDSPEFEKLMLAHGAKLVRHESVVVPKRQPAQPAG